MKNGWGQSSWSLKDETTFCKSSERKEGREGKVGSKEEGEREVGGREEGKWRE